MSIKKYELERPDSDGDCSIDLEFEIENKYDEDIMLIKHNTLHLNENGFLISSDLNNSTECFLEKGDAQELSGWGRIHERYLTKGSTVTAQIQARLFRREFFKFGPFKVSEEEGVTWLEADVDSKVIDNKIKIAMTRFAPDEDGNVRIDFMSKIHNQTGTFLESTELKVFLRDRAGAEVEDTYSSNDMPPHSSTALDPSFWGLKTKKLKDSTIEISLTIYEQVGLQVLEGNTSFSH